MRPPICCICDKKLVNLDEGGFIYFKSRLSDTEWGKKMKEIGGGGHPPYAEWFCKKHYEKVNEFSHLTIDIALNILSSETK